jgi:hypothetical protein
MRLSRNLAGFVLAGSIMRFAGAAGAEDLCPTSDAPRKTADGIKAVPERQGYEVRKMCAEDGCIEAKGCDRNEARVEIYVDPATGEIVKIKS